MTIAKPTARDAAPVRPMWKVLLLRPEMMTLALLVLGLLAASALSPYFLDLAYILDSFTLSAEFAMVALILTMIIIAGEIDLSVASIIALASTAMGLVMSLGAGTPEIVLTGIATGLICGAVNGFLVAGMGLPSIVVTIGTMSLFRGVAFIVLGDQAFNGYPKEFAFFGQGYVWWVISFELVLFAICAVIYWALLHRTTFGRAVYAIGNNATAARFSGIRT